MPIITPQVPDGMVELMKNLAKTVLKEKPQNIYEFAAEYLENMLRERDGSLDKGYGKFRSYTEYCKMLDKMEVRRNKLDKKNDERDSGVDSCTTDDEMTKTQLQLRTAPSAADMEINGVAMQVSERKSTKVPKITSSTKQKVEEKLDQASNDKLIELNDSNEEEMLSATKKEKSKPRKLSSKKPSESLIVIKEESSTDVVDDSAMVVEDEMKIMNKAAVKIQTAFRDFMSKKQNFSIENAAALVIQKSFKSFLSRKKENDNPETIERSVTNDTDDDKIEANIEQTSEEKFDKIEEKKEISLVDSEKFDKIVDETESKNELTVEEKFDKIEDNIEQSLTAVKSEANIEQTPDEKVDKIKDNIEQSDSTSEKSEANVEQTSEENKIEDGAKQASLTEPILTENVESEKNEESFNGEETVDNVEDKSNEKFDNIDIEPGLTDDIEPTLTENNEKLDKIEANSEKNLSDSNKNVDIDLSLTDNDTKFDETKHDNDHNLTVEEKIDNTEGNADQSLTSDDNKVDEIEANLTADEKFNKIEDNIEPSLADREKFEITEAKIDDSSNDIKTESKIEPILTDDKTDDNSAKLEKIVGIEQSLTDGKSDKTETKIEESSTEMFDNTESKIEQSSTDIIKQSATTEDSIEQSLRTADETVDKIEDNIEQSLTTADQIEDNIKHSLESKRNIETEEPTTEVETVDTENSKEKELNIILKTSEDSLTSPTSNSIEEKYEIKTIAIAEKAPIDSEEKELTSNDIADQIKQDTKEPEENKATKFEHEKSVRIVEPMLKSIDNNFETTIDPKSLLSTDDIKRLDTPGSGSDSGLSEKHFNLAVHEGDDVSVNQENVSTEMEDEENLTENVEKIEETADKPKDLFSLEEYELAETVVLGEAEEKDDKKEIKGDGKDEKQISDSDNDLVKSAITIQRIFRGYVVRKNQLIKKDIAAALAIQKHFRGYQIRKNLKSTNAEKVVSNLASTDISENLGEKPDVLESATNQTSHAEAESIGKTEQEVEIPTTDSIEDSPRNSRMDEILNKSEKNQILREVNLQSKSLEEKIKTIDRKSLEETIKEFKISSDKILRDSDVDVVTVTEKIDEQSSESLKIDEKSADKSEFLETSEEFLIKAQQDPSKLNKEKVDEVSVENEDIKNNFAVETKEKLDIVEDTKDIIKEKEIENIEILPEASTELNNDKSDEKEEVHEIVTAAKSKPSSTEAENIINKDENILDISTPEYNHNEKIMKGVADENSKEITKIEEDTKNESDDKLEETLTDNPNDGQTSNIDITNQGNNLYLIPKDSFLERDSFQDDDYDAELPATVAAINIQKAYRGYRVRRDLKMQRDTDYEFTFEDDNNSLVNVEGTEDQSKEELKKSIPENQSALGDIVVHDSNFKNSKILALKLPDIIPISHIEEISEQSDGSDDVVMKVGQPDQTTTSSDSDDTIPNKSISYDPMSSDLSESDEVKGAVDETSRDEREETASDVENFDFSSCGEDSLEAMYYSIRKNEVMLDKMHRRASEQRSASSVEKNEFPKSITGDLESALNEVRGKSFSKSTDSTSDNDDVVMANLSVEDNTALDFYLEESSSDNGEKKEVSELTRMDENVSKTNENEEIMNPMLYASRQKEALLQQMHANDSEDREDNEELDEFPDQPMYDMRLGNIQRKIFASSISETDSDYYQEVPTQQKRLIKDDFNISTAFDHMISTDSDSTVISAATKIQAGARGFLTRRRLRRSSAGTSLSYEKRYSFGNAAIDKSLEDLIEQQEQISLEDAAIKIQHCYRSYQARKNRMKRKLLDQTIDYSVDNYSSSDTDVQYGIIDVKMEQKKIDLNLSDYDDDDLKLSPLSQTTTETASTTTPVTVYEQQNYDNIIITNADNLEQEDLKLENESRQQILPKTHLMSTLNFDELDTAQRRLTLQRGDAMQRNSTPEEIELAAAMMQQNQVQGGPADKSDEKHNNASLDVSSTNLNLKTAGQNPITNNTAAATQTSYNSHSYNISRTAAVALLGPRQRSMPVQFDTELMRPIPKPLRKRVKSAESGKNKRK